MERESHTKSRFLTYLVVTVIFLILIVLGIYLF
jgi:hypothetical protein